MRVIVCGSRDWTDSKLVFSELDRIYGDEAEWGRAHDLVIVHGDCPHGADAFAQQWASAREVKVEPHRADWNKHGKPAGMIRNREMAELGADLCIAFWDAKSPGTRNMIECAVKRGIRVLVIPLSKQ